MDTIELKKDVGKVPLWQGVLSYFPRALEGIARVSEFGSRKYSWGAWATVEAPDRNERYLNAFARHTAALARGGVYASDPETGRLELDHIAWNALALSELVKREQEIDAQHPDEQPPAEEPYPEGCEKCKGWTWDCHKEHHTGEFCSHKCEYPITASESSVYASAFEAGATAAMKAAGRGDERLNRWCDQHGRWFNHVKGCPECNFPTAGSSR